MSRDEGAHGCRGAPQFLKLPSAAMLEQLLYCLTVPCSTLGGCDRPFLGMMNKTKRDILSRGVAVYSPVKLRFHSSAIFMPIVSLPKRYSMESEPFYILAETMAARITASALDFVSVGAKIPAAQKAVNSPCCLFSNMIFIP